MAIRSVRYKENEFPISYEIIGPKADVAILFLHGWGSNKEIMKQAFGRYPHFRKIFVDMPGFGRSANEIVLTTQDYANILRRFLESLDMDVPIVMGHSFGGKVATLMRPKMLVLLSSAGIVVPKPLSVRAKIALYKLLKPFGIAKLRSLFVSKDVKGMDEVMYETFKNVVDEDFSDIFKHFDQKALLFWGREDKATPLSSAEAIASLLPDAKLFTMEGDHYFFLRYGEEILETVKEEYEKV